MIAEKRKMRLGKKEIAQLDSIFKQFGKRRITWRQVMMYCTWYCQLTKLHRRSSLSMYMYIQISCREQAWLIKMRGIKPKFYFILQNEKKKDEVNYKSRY